MRWELARGAEPRVAEIAAAASRASRLYLATDPDREGEAIAWHLLQELQVGTARAGGGRLVMAGGADPHASSAHLRRRRAEALLRSPIKPTNASTRAPRAAPRCHRARRRRSASPSRR